MEGVDADAADNDGGADAGSGARKVASLPWQAYRSPRLVLRHMLALAVTLPTPALAVAVPTPRAVPKEATRAAPVAAAAAHEKLERAAHDGRAIAHISTPVLILKICGRSFPDVREALTAKQRKKRKQIEALGGNADDAIGSTDTFLVIRRAKVRNTGLLQSPLFKLLVASGLTSHFAAPL